MTQEGWAVWEGAARRQYDWVGGQGLSPILGPWGTDPTGDQTRRRASELSTIAAQSAADQVPPWGALHTGPPAPRHAGAHGRRRPPPHPRQAPDTLPLQPAPCEKADSLALAAQGSGAGSYVPGTPAASK